jgi:hypothetical protein
MFNAFKSGVGIDSSVGVLSTTKISGPTVADKAGSAVPVGAAVGCTWPGFVGWGASGGSAIMLPVVGAAWACEILCMQATSVGRQPPTLSVDPQAAKANDAISTIKIKFFKRFMVFLLVEYRKSLLRLSVLSDNNVAYHWQNTNSFQYFPS